VPGSAVVAVDEIELGLEPHRLAHLLQKLARQASENSVQVMFTTHSPVVVEALTVADLVVVRSTEGTTTVASVPLALDEAQGAVRAAPSALLGRRVGVGEGATEVGLLRGLHRILDSRRSAAGLDTSAVTGFVVSNGNGNMACPRAAIFARLGYPSLALIDNDDRTVDSGVAPAEQAGTQILRWDYGMAIEHQLAHDLDLACLQELVDLASLLNDTDEIALRDSVQSRLNTSVVLPGHTVQQWADAAAGGLAEVRVAIGQTAHKKGWFKREDHGEALAGLIDGLWDTLAGTTTASVLSALVRFIYDDPEAAFLRPQPTP
jgi:putative ATP-dependent endonuclease of OLD family